MRTTGLMITLLVAFCTVVLLGVPALADEGQQDANTEIAAEIEPASPETPPVDAPPADVEKEQEGEKAEQADQD